MEAEALESGGGERQGSIYVRISVSVAELQPGSIQPNKLLWKCLLGGVRPYCETVGTLSEAHPRF